MKFSFKETDHGWREILKTAKAFKRAAPYVKVGVLGGAKNRREGEKIGNVELALIHEFGSPKNGIPERSFIRAPFRVHRAEYLKLLRRLLAGNLTKGGMGMIRALALVGEKMAADFKKMAPGTPPPNAPSTLRRKQAKSRPGAPGTPRALVDTGRMIGSITYAVVEDGRTKP